MRAEPGSFLTLHYRLSRLDAGGEATPFVDTFGERPATLTLGAGELSPAMEERLVGLEAGSRASFDLDPGIAFGPRSEALVQRVDRASLEAEAGGREEAGGWHVGDVIQCPAPDGVSSIAGIVRAVDDRSVTCDFNHPLAGRAVRFDVQLIGVL